MKCLYSFWSKPFLAKVDSGLNMETSTSPALSGSAGFSCFEDFLNSWVLSVELSSKHYRELELVTDTWGKVLLVDRLKLPFTSVITELDNIPEHVSSKHWSLSKIVAYSLQNEPFIHVDGDVYLWKKLPDELEDAPVFGQNTDSLIWLNLHYTEPYFLMYRYLKVLPKDFTYIPGKFHEWDTAICCGIIGGQDWELIKSVASEAVNVFCCDENKRGWDIVISHDLLWGDRLPSYGCIGVVEQYGIAKECWLRGIWGHVKFLLDEDKISTDMQYLKKRCADLGYTHLINRTKRNSAIMERLRRRIIAEYSRYLPLISELVQAESIYLTSTSSISK